ncbi:Receptor-like protein 39 [Glycine soja]
MKIQVVSTLVVMPLYWLCLCNHFLVVGNVLMIRSLCCSNLRTTSHSLEVTAACSRGMQVMIVAIGWDYLDLSHNKFTGPITSFGMPKNLIDLDLSGNHLNGIIPSSHFEGLHNLVYIDLSYNFFTWSIPSSIFTLPSMQWILLDHNQFSQLDKFINVTFSILDTLDLSSNNLSGPFRTSVLKLSTLSTLRLSSNKFNGISYLYLASCNLKTFPSFLRNLSGLVELDLSDNQIRGILEEPLQNLTFKLTILDYPEDLMDVKTLHVLNLSNHAVSGNLKQLESLDLSQNSLSGEIPIQLASLSFISYLNLSFNHLVGKIPTSTQIQSFPASSFEGNGKLYGPPLTGKIDGKESKLIGILLVSNWDCFWSWNCFLCTLDLEAMESMVLTTYSQNSMLDLPLYVY